MSVEEVCRKYSTDIVQVRYLLQSDEESYNDPLRVLIWLARPVLSIVSLFFPDMNELEIHLKKSSLILDFLHFKNNSKTALNNVHPN